MNEKHIVLGIVAVAIGGIVYAFYRDIKKAATAVASAASNVADKTLAAPLAEVITSARRLVNPRIGVIDGAVLPNDTVMTFNELISAGGKITSDNLFTWKGITYKLITRRPDGWYDAVRA